MIFGVLTTAVNWLVFFPLYNFTPLRAYGTLCNAIAWIVAVAFAFVTNKWWVFESHTLIPSEVWKEFVSFVVCRIATFIFNIVALFVMVDLMDMEFFVCKLLISVVVVVLNYVFSKILIFAKKKDKA